MVQLFLTAALLAGALPKPQSIAQAAGRLVKDGKQLEALAGHCAAVLRGNSVTQGRREALNAERQGGPKRRAAVLAAVMDTAPCSRQRFVPFIERIRRRDPRDRVRGGCGS